MLACKVAEHLDVAEHILSGLDAALTRSTPYLFPPELVDVALRYGVVMTASARFIECSKA